MGKPAARVGDMHTCPLVNPGPTPHVGGPVLSPGAVTVLIGGQPAARVGDMALCTGQPDLVSMGSFTVLIGGRPAARLGDMTAHGGTIVAGCPTVLIGGFGVGGSGSIFAFTMSTAKMSGAPFTRLKCDKGVSPPSVPPDMSEAAKGLFHKLSGVAKDLYHGVFGEKYTDGITIRGRKGFREKTRMRLNELGQTASGKKIIDSLDEQGRKGRRVTIVPAEPGDNHARPTGWFGGWKKAFPKKAVFDPVTGRIKITDSGRGTSSEVGFNPDYEPRYANGSSCRSPAVGLGHELLHALHNAEGKNLAGFKDPTDPGTVRPSNHEEAQTIGRGAYTGDDPTDNSLRRELGYKERTSHGSICP